MGGKGDSRRRVSREDKMRFLAALRAGLKRDEAAAQAGFTANAFYYARRRDPLFALAWRWAHDLSAAEAHAARRAGRGGDVRVAPNAKRRLQARPVRRAIFDDGRKRLFLDHFAGTADVKAAADAAGVSVSAVTHHRRTDPEFAAGCDEALAIAYASLEAEAVRQRLEGQRNLRDGITPKGEMPREFDRVLRLLARYERKTGRIGFRERSHGRDARWSFDDAMALLDRKLRALGARRGIAPPPIALPSPREEKE
jgi:hypothetical protein